MATGPRKSFTIEHILYGPCGPTPEPTRTPASPWLSPWTHQPPPPPPPPPPHKTSIPSATVPASAEPFAWTCWNNYHWPYTNTWPVLTPASFHGVPPSIMFLPSSPSPGASLLQSKTTPSSLSGDATSLAAGGWRQPRKGGQVRFSTDQSRQLEKTFSQQRYLTPVQRRHLANKLALTERQVKTWMQNRRAKWRRMRKDNSSQSAVDDDDDELDDGIGDSVEDEDEEFAERDWKNLHLHG